MDNVYKINFSELVDQKVICLLSVNDKKWVWHKRSKAYRVYNIQTLCVEESMHVKFDDKEPGNETPEQDESFADIQVPEDTPEPDQINESEDSLEADPTPEAQNEVASDVAQDGS